MVTQLKLVASEMRSSFVEEAGRYLGFPSQPWLGISLYLASAFTVGNLLNVLWVIFGQSIA